MTAEVAVTSSFDGDALLRGFQWLGEAQREQTQLLDRMAGALERTRVKTKENEKANEGLMSSVVKLDAAVNLAEKAFELFAKGVEKTVGALRAAADYSRALDSQFRATEDRVQDLTIAVAQAAEKSGALNGIFDGMQESLAGLTRWMSSPEGVDAVNTFFQIFARVASATALATGALFYSVNRVREAIKETVMIFADPAVAAAYAMQKREEELAGPKNDLSTLLYNLSVQLDAAAKAGPTDKPPKPKATRTRAQDGAPDMSFIQFNMNWLNEKIAQQAGSSYIAETRSLYRDEELAAMEHARELEDIRDKDLDSRKEWALETLNTTSETFTKLASVTEAGIVAQAELAVQLQNIFVGIGVAMGDLVIAATDSIITGTDSILGALGNLLAGFIRMLGEMLMRASIGIGIFAALTGNLYSVGIAAAAFAVGAGLIVFANEIGGGGGGGGGGGRQSAYVGREANRAGKLRGATSKRDNERFGRYGGGQPVGGVGDFGGFVSAPGGGTTVNYYNLDLRDSTIVDPSSGGNAGLGRVLRRSIDRADRLGGRGGRGGP